MSEPSPKNIAVAGGGLAGLAAGCALANAGYRVTLFERRPYLGGRASSYEHPGTGEVVDNCQHVLLGCCTNLIDFYRRLGVENKIRWYDHLTFLEPAGSAEESRASIIGSSSLPAPFHALPSFFGADCLNLSDKLTIASAMAALISSLPHDDGRSFLDWLKQNRQTDRAIDRFWKTILVSALNEDLDRISIPYAAQVIRESFLKSAEAGKMGVPTVPLTELYGVAADYVTARGGEVRLRSSVESFSTHETGVEVVTAGRRERFDSLVLALPYNGIAAILPETAPPAPWRAMLAHFESSPITGIHLWFDRQISGLDHAVLLDRTIQWMFHKSKLLGRTDAGSYVELVVSSSKSLVEKSKQEIVDLALSELREFFPEARSANLIKSTVIKEVHATYSPKPGIDKFRPAPQTPWPRVFLAGDWIATGWPATMEGAVRSGYLAAETLMESLGNNQKILVPDLPAQGLMRLFR
ncbi:MAG TPA: hydroxysqualene dehydroxylase HpnE [Terriglobales bacterium]